MSDLKGSGPIEFDKPATKLQVWVVNVSIWLVIATLGAVTFGFAYNAPDVGRMVAAGTWFLAVELFMSAYLHHYRQLIVEEIFFFQLILAPSVFFGLTAWGWGWSPAIVVSVAWTVGWWLVIQIRWRVRQGSKRQTRGRHRKRRWLW